MEVSFIILGQIPLLFKPIVGYLSEKQKERGESIRKSIRKDSKRMVRPIARAKAGYIIRRDPLSIGEFIWSGDPCPL